MLVTMPYTQAGAIVPGGPAGAIRWATNAVDPTNGGSPSPFPGKTALSLLYNYYEAVSYSGTLQMVNTDAVPTNLYFLHQVTDPTTSVTNYEARSGLRFNAASTLGALGSGRDSYTHRFSHRISAIVADSKTQTDRDFSGIFSSGSQTQPTDLTWMGVGAVAYDGASNIGVSYLLRMKVRFLLTDPVPLTN